MNTSKKIRTRAALGSLYGAVWAATYATFTDAAASSATFTAGTVDLVVGGDVDDAHDFAALTVPNMKPGDVVYAPLSVANTGTLDFTYGMTATTTDTAGAGLGEALRVAVRTVAAATDCSEAGWAGGTNVVSTSPFATAAFDARPMASSTTEVLCFAVGFPNGAAGADNHLQGAATSATLSFTATTPAG